MIRLGSIFCALVSLATAGVPSSDVSVDLYQDLWQNSPFTSRPVERPVPASNRFDDYALGGVSKIADGYFVVLIEKRSPHSRIVISPGVATEIRVVSVNWSSQDWKHTSVVITDGESTSPVGFDETLLFRAQKHEAVKAARPRLLRQPQ